MEPMTPSLIIAEFHVARPVLEREVELELGHNERASASEVELEAAGLGQQRLLL